MTAAERILSQSPVWLADALAAVLPGGNVPSPNTLNRWTTTGIQVPGGGRVVLETVKIGGRLATSADAVGGSSRPNRSRPPGSRRPTRSAPRPAGTRRPTPPASN